MSEDLPDRTRSERSQQETLDNPLSFRVDDNLLSEVERLVDEGEYENRSEAARELLSVGVDEVSD
jgi:hypothetical protein